MKHDNKAQNKHALYDVMTSWCNWKPQQQNLIFNTHQHAFCFQQKQIKQSDQPPSVFFFNKSHKQYLWCQHSWELVEIQINECDGVGIFHLQPCFHLINWAPAVDVIFWSYINDNLRFESGTYSAFSFCLIRFSTVWSHMCWELMVSNVIHHSVGLGWEIMIWLSCQSLVFLFIFFDSIWKKPHKLLVIERFFGSSNKKTPFDTFSKISPDLFLCWLVIWWRW